MTPPMLPVDPSTVPAAAAPAVLWVIALFAGLLFVIGLGVELYYRRKDDRS